jgi:hypothetical protein
LSKEQDVERSLDIDLLIGFSPEVFLSHGEWALLEHRSFYVSIYLLGSTCCLAERAKAKRERRNGKFSPPKVQI